jgi:methylmalonyl-CoA/ethylmalonyl-CoA epimerase
MLSSFSFHHIAIATPSIRETSKYYMDAGYTMSEVVYDPVQDVYITFLEKASGYPPPPRIELLEPGSDKSPVSKTIGKAGVSPYHICYEVEDITEVIKELKKQKYIVLSNPVNAVAINNRNICFLFNKAVGLIELVEK